MGVRALFRARALGASAVLWAAACGHPRTPVDGDAGGTDAGGADADAGGGDGGEALDPGRVVSHRLSNTEYDHTVHDLLGVEGQARATFPPDEIATFDNTAEALSVNQQRYESYFLSAESLSEAVFADPALRARIVTCAPAGVDATACASQIVRAFGRRAWRRPLADADVSRFVAIVTDAMAAGKDFDGAMKVVVEVLLASPEFLFHLELDPDPTSVVPHALSPWELASRLSYFLWTTMPDDELAARADDGTLARADVLSAEVDRLLADARADAFVESFTGQWLRIDDVSKSTVVLPDGVDRAILADMQKELSLYVAEFAHGTRPFDDLLSADFNFVNARLAQHYGMDATGLGDQLVRVENTSDHRKGFLELAGSLVAEYGHVTDPWERGWRLGTGLLCAPFVVLPASHEVIDMTFPNPKPETSEVAATIRATDADPRCSSCHLAFDPLGLAFEDFDVVGRFRTSYPNGDTIATGGVLADGTRFKDPLELADALARDPRWLACTAKMALSYALGRAPADADAPYLARIGTAWKQQGLALRALLKTIVLDDIFRLRRGEAPP
jgi:hypothetical protein